MWEEYETAGDDCIPIEQWGKDHWSTLAYLETVTVDYRGLVDNRRRRCNPRLHREFAHADYFGVMVDGSPYPTRTKVGEVQRHDDWSCLEDLVVAGLVKAYWRVRYPERSFGGAQAKVELTELGLTVAAALRAHKARGGSFASFSVVLPAGEVCVP